jgi:hypothetical protein
MPQCTKCGKKGLFLKIEDDTGLCLSCNEDFAKQGKVLTEKIVRAKNSATTAKDPKEIVKVKNCWTSLQHIKRQENRLKNSTDLWKASWILKCPAT